MRQCGVLLLLFSFLILSCVSVPEAAEPIPADPPQTVSAPPPQTAEPTETETAAPPELPAEETPEEAEFDPESISQEQFDTAKAEVQDLIEELNRIIRARNYNAWTRHLAEPYVNTLSSQSFLAERTEELFKRDQIVAANLGRDPKLVEKKILKTAKDYFDHVVVPSRSNDHLDTIVFVSEKRVKAYTVDLRGNRLVLYDLEVIDGEWKIIS